MRASVPLISTVHSQATGSPQPLKPCKSKACRFALAKTQAMLAPPVNSVTDSHKALLERNTKR